MRDVVNSVSNVISLNALAYGLKAGIPDVLQLHMKQMETEAMEQLLHDDDCSDTAAQQVSPPGCLCVGSCLGWG